MSAHVCTSCGIGLDPDAPGTSCAVCHGEQPSPSAPVAAPRRPSARPPLSAFGRVAARGGLLSHARGVSYEEGFAESAGLERTEVKA